MSEPVKPKPGPNAKDQANNPFEVEGPPEESFEEKYNSRLEFPLSLVSTVLLHVLVGTLLVYLLLQMQNNEDKSGPKVQLINVDGLDEAGLGSPGSGGVEDPLAKSDNDPVKSAIESLPDPSKLPEIKENLKQTIKTIDPTGNMPVSDANAAAYASLNESVRNKLLGARQGAGPEQGSGFDGSKGKGPGGSGSDSTLGRNMRWVLRFKVNSGRDYLEQLNAMGAKILVPVPPDGSKCMLIEDIKNPSVQRVATDSDLRGLGNQIKFSDSRRDAVQGVAGALGLDFTPKTFWAFFPKGLEDELARKETNYRNRRSEDIEETIFRVVVRGGEYEVVVDEQKVKR